MNIAIELWKGKEKKGREEGLMTIKKKRKKKLGKKRKNSSY